MNDIYLTIFFLILNIILWKNLNYITKIFDVYDIPNKKLKLHDNKVSLISGFYIFLSVLLFFFLSKLEFFSLKNIILDDYKIIIFITTIFIIGYMDDKKGINPLLRLFLFTIVFTVFLISSEEHIIKEVNFINYKIQFNTNFNIFFTIFCFLVYLNALNFFDGINLQAGLHCILILFILFVKSNFNLEIYIIVIFYLFFLYYNWNNLAFLGNSGTYISAIIISLFFINFSQQKIITATEIFVLMSLPGIDMIRLVIVRIYKNKNPFKGDLNHLHHLAKKKIGLFKTNMIIIFSQVINYLIYIIFFNDYLSFFTSVLIYIVLYTFFINDKNLIKKNYKNL
tara:strand:+ start:24913 stop:25929 length:1017 start_codon:yes stop_codon:yes gene_type:complete